MFGYGDRPGGDPAIGDRDSWYAATERGRRNFEALSGDCRADVCVVGAGYTGLSAALELAERGYDVVVLEAHRVAAGASGRNGGLLGMGQRQDQQILERWLGEERARALWQLGLDANALVRERIDRYGIDCELKDGELTVAHKARYTREIWAYGEHLRHRYGYEDIELLDVDAVRELLGTDRVYGGYLDRRAGHLHPLNLALGLAGAAADAGARLHEHSAVVAFEETGTGVTVRTARGRVDARALVLACNGYLGRLDRTMERYQLPINNFVLATEPLGPRAAQINRDDLAVVDTRFVVSYFHNSPDGRLIFGGGENYSPNFPVDLKAFVRRRMLTVYPELADARIDYAWGGTLAITVKRMPHFGRRDGRVYWAQGYSGHGIAMANLGGKLVADAIDGDAGAFEVFAGLPHRAFPGGRWLRRPALVAAMLFYATLDRL